MTVWDWRLVYTQRGFCGLDEASKFIPVDLWHTCVHKLPFIGKVTDEVYLQPAAAKPLFGEMFRG